MNRSAALRIREIKKKRERLLKAGVKVEENISKREGGKGKMLKELEGKWGFE
ncbi:unnamed protein product [Sphenostylis stenocarpa]|uniref:Uncharacterized protein n=1 Tax=Sphenostylis stenocarpa TaxID=92480 RepID=A0AA86T7V4_9FABA|nr:unnamed protein product [Sphenostylis stenocarpa]